MVVLGWVEGELSEWFTGGCDDSDVDSGDEHDDSFVVVVSSDADVVEVAVVSEGDGARFVYAVLTDSDSFH